MHERERWQVIKAMLKEQSAGSHRRRLPRHRRLRSFGAPRFCPACRTGFGDARARRTRGHAGFAAGVERRAGAGDPLLRDQQDAQCRRQAGDRPGRGRAVQRRRRHHHQWRHHDLRDGRIPARAPPQGAHQFLSARRDVDPPFEMSRRAAGRRGLSRTEADRLAVRGGRDPALFGLAHVHERDFDRPARRDRGRSLDRPRRDQAAQARREAGGARRQLQIHTARQPGGVSAVANFDLDHRRRGPEAGARHASRRWRRGDDLRPKLPTRSRPHERRPQRTRARGRPSGAAAGGGRHRKILPRAFARCRGSRSRSRRAKCTRCWARTAPANPP